MPAPRFILASASPRRRELLHEAGYAFEVHPADIDEDDYPPTILPADLALRLATLKAQAIAEKFPEDIVLAADTVVAFGDKPLGKPEDADGAFQMLQLLSGTTHLVITGVALRSIALAINQSTRVMSAVRMKMLTIDQINAYVASNDWQGKAGGYGIQDDRPDPFVTRLTGSHTNIVGLPMETVIKMLNEAQVFPTR